MSNIGTITGESYVCDIIEDADGRGHFVADADIDADGANGQNGGPAAYKADDSGTEALANGGMAIKDGRVICAHNWARSIVILGPDNQPKIFPGGIIAQRPGIAFPARSSGILPLTWTPRLSPISSCHR